MAHQRSPNCPQLSFAEAAEKGRKVYEEEHTHHADKLVVANDLGYTTINGRSLSLIGTLRQYGILEGSRQAMRVSDDAVAYYELEDGPEKQAASVRMAFRPPLFAELRSQYGETLPSEANLRHWLIKKGFLPKAATDIIRVYKSNLELVSGEQTPYSGDELNRQEVPMSDTRQEVPPTSQRQVPGVQSYAFALSPHARAELSLKGTITVQDLEMLRDHVELTIKALARSAEPEGKTDQ